MKTAKENQKYLQDVVKGMVMVGQLGFSLVTPPLVLTLLGFWLKTRFQLGGWIVVLMLFVGIMTLISTAKSYYDDISKKTKNSGPNRPSRISFTDHR